MSEIVEVWMTDEYVHNYGELTLPGRVVNGQLEIAVVFDRFEFCETDDPPDDDAEPWDYPTKPDAIHVSSTTTEYCMDIPLPAPTALALLNAGLVPDMPDYVQKWLKEGE